MLKIMMRLSVGVCSFLFVFGSGAYGQKGAASFEVGGVTNQFGSGVGQFQTNVTQGVLSAQLLLSSAIERGSGVALPVGVEFRFPLMPTNSEHTTEFAGYFVPSFRFNRYSVGGGLQLRKVYLPSPGSVYAIYSPSELLFEIPIFAKVTFGHGGRAYAQVQYTIETSPVFATTSPQNTGGDPTWDHGYGLRTTFGYVFHGRLYLKAQYEQRAFLFQRDAINANGQFDWRSRQVTGGFGFTF